MLATAIPVARLLLGDASDFRIEPPALPGAESAPLWFVLGAIAGGLAIAYNRSLLATLALRDRLAAIPTEWRAAAIGAGVGALAWFAPEWVGGGDRITQQALLGQPGLGIVALAFVIRFALGAISYAAGTPGGLFAPLLVLGAQAGLLYGAACHALFPSLAVQPTAFAVVGMAAFFTGVVRSPLTGIVLVAEMTASATLLLPMLAACFVAMLLPTLLRDPPIYEFAARAHAAAGGGDQGEAGVTWRDSRSAATMRGQIQAADHGRISLRRYGPRAGAMRPARPRHRG